MTAILAAWGFIPSWAKQLIMYALVALGAIGGYAAWSVHKVDEGKAEQRQLDAQQYAKQAAAALAKAAAAEKAHEKELTDLRAFRDDHPVGTVQLCRQATVVRPRVSAPSGASAGVVLDVPTPDLSGGAGTAGPDIGPMLELLAGKADEVSAALRKDEAK